MKHLVRTTAVAALLAAGAAAMPVDSAHAWGWGPGWGGPGWGNGWGDGTGSGAIHSTRLVCRSNRPRRGATGLPGQGAKVARLEALQVGILSLCVDA